MIILLNKVTKLSGYFQSMDKEYIAGIKLGLVTDTWDIEGKVIEQKSTVKLNPDKIKEVVSSFYGDFYQTPPIYSAKKIKGKPAYYYARYKKNYEQNIELKKEKVKIYKIDIISLLKDILTIKVRCSSGTYIRSLAFDIGKKLGCGATIVELIRNKIGSYDINKSIELEDLECIAEWPTLKNNYGIIRAEDIAIPLNYE